MKFNKWTMGLAAVGVVSLASAARADEKMSQVQTALSNTTLSGYVDTSAQWNLGSQNGGSTPGYAFGPGKADGLPWGRTRRTPQDRRAAQRAGHQVQDDRQGLRRTER